MRRIGDGAETKRHVPNGNGGPVGGHRRDTPLVRASRQAGFVAAELAAGIGLLVLPVAILVISLPIWSEVQSMGRVAAQQAARAAVVADRDETAAAAATQAARVVVANHGRQLSQPVALSGSLEPVAGAGGQQHITATVTVELPLVGLPFLADLTAVDWEVSHTQPVDLYRSYP